MQLLGNNIIIDIIESTLNYVDSRLVDHGRRVAANVLKMLKFHNKHTDEEMRDICIVAILHDIGAYKTEDIDEILQFETKNIWEHSVYGSLFIKYFTPLQHLAPILLFHHANCKELEYLHKSQHELAQILSIADKLDILHQSGIHETERILHYFNQNRGKKYLTDMVDLLINSGVAETSLDAEPVNLKALKDIINIKPFTEDELNSYLKTIVLSIDFRSPQTVTHTITAACTSKHLAEWMELTEEEVREINTAAMLHDLGKQGIPTEILESPNRLSPEEMNIMKQHVEYSDQILFGKVDDKIRHIAVRHHEKLNGSGYPLGLNGEVLSKSERIMAVADILSALCGVRSYKEAFPKEKVIGILNSMAADNFIDSQIVQTVETHFDRMMEIVYEETKPIIDTYTAIQFEYKELLEKVKNFLS